MMERWKKWSKIAEVLQKNKLALLVLAVGICLLLLPGQRDAAEDVLAQSTAVGTECFDLDAAEEKLEHILSEIEGAGSVAVALTVQSSSEHVYAENRSQSADDNRRDEETEVVIISNGSGVEQAVLVQQHYPAFRGAVVVCDGGGDPAVRLLITQAVSDLTGLGSDRILVCKSK